MGLVEQRFATVPLDIARPNAALMLGRVGREATVEALPGHQNSWNRFTERFDERPVYVLGDFVYTGHNGSGQWLTDEGILSGVLGDLEAITVSSSTGAGEETVLGARFRDMTPETFVVASLIREMNGDAGIFFRRPVIAVTHHDFPNSRQEVSGKRFWRTATLDHTQTRS